MNASYKDTAKETVKSVSAAATKTAADAMDTARDVAYEAKDAVTKTADTAMNAARDMAGDAKDAATDAMNEGRSMLGGALSKAKDTAQGAGEAIMSGAGATLASVRDVAVEKADAARESLSDVGERLAATLQRASDDPDGDALKSRMLGSVAKGLTSASDALRERSVSDLADDIRTLARKHPGAFMAAAAVVGFAAARFLRSSSERREPRV